ncbi:MAG: winged helix-turn-helix domain-containing protein [Pseudomonadota bacterium]
MTATDVMIEYRFPGFRLDVWQRKLLKIEGDPVTLSSRAMDTLLVLLEHRGETLSKSQLMQTVWPNVVVEENNLNQAISSLRKALGDNKTENNFILTVPLRGYCFVAPVEVVQLPPPGSVTQVISEATPEVSDAEAAATIISSTRAKFFTIPRALLLLLVVAGAAVMLLKDSLLPQQNTGIATAAASSSDLPENAFGLDAVATIRNSIAVLPLTNLNPDSDNDLFAVGLHDEVINQLSKIRSLKVISRDSVMALVNRDLPMPDVGRLLRVETMMTGTVLFAADDARISMQMLDAATGVTLWAETYEANKQDLAEMISIQSDIAVNVATALKAKIEQSEQEVIGALPTESFEAYRYNLAARNAHYQQEFAKEWHIVREAIELDPNYFDALHTYATVNTVLVGRPMEGMTNRAHFEIALETAEKMIEIAPDRSGGYTEKAVALGTSKDWEGVSEMLDTLVRMEVPASDLKHIALLLMCMGNFDKAIEIYEANLTTEPVNLYGRAFLMSAYEMIGDTANARREYEIGEELSPVWWGDTINIFLALGRKEPLQDINELVGISEQLKYLLLNLHDVELVKAGLRSFQASTNKISAETVYYGAIAASIGENELAMTLMRDALTDVWTSLYLLWLPVFDDARELDSFKLLMQDSGIIDFWKQRGWPEVCQPVGDSFTCKRNSN